MADFSAGKAGALAYQHDWQQSINTLYKREEHASRVRAEVEQKTQYYSKLLEKKDLTSPYNNARLQKFYSEHLPKIGQYITENPDFETDIGKHAQFMQMAGQLQDNDIIREEIQVQKEREYLSQNRDNLTKEEFFEQNQWLDNYSNQDPDAPEKIDPYFFNNHLIVNPVDIFKDAANSLATTEYEKDGMKYRTYNKNDLKLLRATYMADEKNYNAVKRNWEESGAKEEGLYKSPEEFFEGNVNAMFNKSQLPSSSGSGPSDVRNFTTPVVDIYNRIRNGTANTTNRNAVALTAFGKPNALQSVNTLEQDGKVFALVNGQYMEFNQNFQFESLEGGGNIYTDAAGNDYVSVPVRLTTGTAEAEDLTDNYGFNAAIEPGWMPAGLDGEPTTLKPIRGEIYVPLSLSHGNQQAYNESFYTKDALSKNQYGQQEDRMLREGTATLQNMRKRARAGNAYTVQDGAGKEYTLDMNKANYHIDSEKGGGKIIVFQNGGRWEIKLDIHGNPETDEKKNIVAEFKL